MDAAYARIRDLVWDAEAGDDSDELLAGLVPLERAIYVTRELEQELADGGWYLVFANEDDRLIAAAIDGYELLGLPAYAAHLRHVQRTEFGDASGEDESETLDEAFRALSGAEEARAAALRTQDG